MGCQSITCDGGRLVDRKGIELGLKGKGLKGKGLNVLDQNMGPVQGVAGCVQLEGGEPPLLHLICVPPDLFVLDCKSISNFFHKNIFYGSWNYYLK